MSEDLDELANKMAGAISKIKEEGHQSDIEPMDAYTARKKEEILQELYEEQELFSEGYESILEKVQDDPDLDINDFLFTEDQLAVFEDQEKMAAAEEEHIPCQELLGISDEQMHVMYQIAVDYFREENYQKSRAVFTFLAQTNPYIAPIWIGLGSSYRALGNNQKAIGAYYEAVILEPISLEPYAHAVGCLVAMDDIATARELLLDAERIAEEATDEPDIEIFKEGIKEYLKELENTKK